MHDRTLTHMELAACEHCLAMITLHIDNLRATMFYHRADNLAEIFIVCDRINRREINKLLPRSAQIEKYISSYGTLLFSVGIVVDRYMNKE